MEQGLEVRDYILEESDKLFCQYGFKSVTMDDIAKHLGMSKKTIYQNFSDKNELVNILIDNKLLMQSCKIKECSVNAENAVHELFLTIKDVKNILSTLNPKLFYDLQKYHPKAWLAFKTFKENKLGLSIEANIKRGVAEGLYRSDINLDILTQLRIDQANIIFNQYDHYTMNKYSIAQVIIEITQHFIYGICNQKGLVFVEEYKNQLAENKL